MHGIISFSFVCRKINWFEGEPCLKGCKHFIFSDGGNERNGEGVAVGIELNLPFFKSTPCWRLTSRRGPNVLLLGFGGDLVYDVLVLIPRSTVVYSEQERLRFWRLYV